MVTYTTVIGGNVVEHFHTNFYDNIAMLFYGGITNTKTETVVIYLGIDQKDIICSLIFYTIY